MVRFVPATTRASVERPLAAATALVRECAQEMPHLELVFEELPTPAQPIALRDGRLDLGVCHASPLSAVDERGVERTHLTIDLVNCALVASTSPLAAQREHKFLEAPDQQHVTVVSQ